MTNTLDPPPIAANADAIEVVRVWYQQPREGAELTFRPDVKHPRAWGLILAEITRQLVKSYVEQGKTEAEAIDAIHARYNQEIKKHFPTVFLS